MNEEKKVDRQPLLEGEKKMLLNEFQSALRSISEAYEREFRKLNHQVAEMEPAISKIRKIIHEELSDKIAEVESQKTDCQHLIKQLGSASRELKKFLKNYDKKKIEAVLEILRIIKGEKDD